MSEFKVGDWVIDTFIGNSVFQYDDGFYQFLGERYVELFLIHATPEEIKAGRRLP